MPGGGRADGRAAGWAAGRPARCGEARAARSPRHALPVGVLAPARSPPRGRRGRARARRSRAPTRTSPMRAGASRRSSRSRASGRRRPRRRRACARRGALPATGRSRPPAGPPAPPRSPCTPSRRRRRRRAAPRGRPAGPPYAGAPGSRRASSRGGTGRSARTRHRSTYADCGTEGRPRASPRPPARESLRRPETGERRSSSLPRRRRWQSGCRRRGSAGARRGSSERPRGRRRRRAPSHINGRPSPGGYGSSRLGHPLAQRRHSGPGRSGEPACDDRRAARGPRRRRFRRGARRGRRRLGGRERRGRPVRGRRPDPRAHREAAEPRPVRGPPRRSGGGGRRARAAPRCARHARPGCASVRAVAHGGRRDGVERSRPHRERERVRELLAPARRARLARLLRPAADDQLRDRGLRPLPEGDDLLPRASSAARFGIRALSYPLLRHPPGERRHVGSARPRRPAADLDLARVRLRLRPSYEPRALRPARDPPRRRLRRRARHARVAVLPCRRRVLSRQRSAPRRGAAAAAGRPHSRCRVRARGGGVRRARRSFAPGDSDAGAGDARVRARARARNVEGSRRARAGAPRPVILVVFGTTGELIKLAPVLLRLDERGHPYVLATTGQQVEQIPSFLEQFGLRQPDLWLGRGAGGRDLRVNRDIPGWLTTVGRSYLRHPFPEELNRRLASALSRIDYAPGPWAASNLRGGDIVDTGSNTIRDSLELVPDGDPPFTLPAQPFGIVSLHRFELLNSRRLLTEAVELLADAASRTPLLFVDHPVTSAALERFRLERLFDASRFVRVPRLRFFDFVRAERRSAFVVTYSGGSQEECYYLDLPCLVHRVRTERREGLGENAVLSGMRADVLRDFLGDPARFRRRTPLPTESPSDVIVEDLERRGFAAG